MIGGLGILFVLAFAAHTAALKEHFYLKLHTYSASSKYYLPVHTNDRINGS